MKVVYFAFFRIFMLLKMSVSKIYGTSKLPKFYRNVSPLLMNNPGMSQGGRQGGRTLRRGLSTLKGGNSRVYPYPSRLRGGEGFRFFQRSSDSIFSNHP